MASSDLKGDFGGWLDATIIELQTTIENYDSEDWATPKEWFIQRQKALIMARCEFWEVLAR